MISMNLLNGKVAYTKTRFKDEDMLISLIQDKDGYCKVVFFPYVESLKAWEFTHPTFKTLFYHTLDKCDSYLTNSKRWNITVCPYGKDKDDTISLVSYWEDFSITPNSKIKRWSDIPHEQLDPFQFILKRWHDETLDHFLSRMSFSKSDDGNPRVYFEYSTDYKEFIDEISFNKYWDNSDYTMLASVFLSAGSNLKDITEYIKPDKDCMDLLDSVKLPDIDPTIVKPCIMDFPSGPILRTIINPLEDGQVYVFFQLRSYPGTDKDFNWHKFRVDSFREFCWGIAPSWNEFNDILETGVPDDFEKVYLSSDLSKSADERALVTLVGNICMKRYLSYWYLNSCEKKPIYVTVEPSSSPRTYTHHMPEGKQRVVHRYVSLTEEYRRIVKGQARVRTESSKDGLHQEERIIKPFIRNQHYGPNRSLTKSVFISGFTRKQWVSDAIVVTHVRK